ncbi:MAG: hypothetical protein L6R42_011070 [Xanthoria sp. 1 TBL-2021]|nr:MAG: hypothetical protein L6R42_011070 [Xanthoria sp. 1 TBL-2021]
MRFFAAALILLTPFIVANPLEVRESSPSWPERFALLDRDGCYKVKRDLGLKDDAIPEYMKRQCDPNNPCVYLCGRY